MTKVLKLDEGVEPLIVDIGGRQIEVPHPADVDPEVLDRLAALSDLDEENVSFSNELADEALAVARAIAPDLPEDLTMMRAFRFLGWYGTIMGEYISGMPDPKSKGKSRVLRGFSRQ